MSTSAGCDGSRRDKCDWYDTDVVTYCPWLRSVMVRGVSGVTLTWLRTVLSSQGVMESRYYPWYAV